MQELVRQNPDKLRRRIGILEQKLDDVSDQLKEVDLPVPVHGSSSAF